MGPNFSKVIQLLEEANILIHEAYIETAKFRHPEERRLAALACQVTMDTNHLSNLRLRLSIENLRRVANESIHKLQ